MIRTRALGRRFGRNVIFRDLELSVEAGERVALTGANGSGKTTLLRILSTLLTPTQGEAWIDGHSIQAHPRTARARLGFVPATDQGFFPRLSGMENLLFFASLRGLGPRETQTTLDSLPVLRPLEMALSSPFHVCSTGMRQALLLARACLGAPSVLLLDEPTRSLDRETTAELHRFLKAWSEAPGRALLLATHSDAELGAVCSREIRIGDAPKEAHT